MLLEKTNFVVLFNYAVCYIGYVRLIQRSGEAEAFVRRVCVEHFVV